MNDQPKKQRRLHNPREGYDFNKPDDYDVTRLGVFKSAQQSLLRFLIELPEQTATYGRIARELPECERFLDVLLAHLSANGTVDYNPDAPPPSKIRLLNHRECRKRTLSNWGEQNSFLYPKDKKKNRIFPTEAMTEKYHES